MAWYEIFAIAGLAFCLISCMIMFFRLASFGKPADHSAKRGKTGSAVFYSFTGAMDPRKKESAYLHLPTYMAGMVYHLGTFTAIAVFLMSLLRVLPPGDIIRSAIAGVLIVSGGSGLAILIKRMVNRNLRALSNPDDFIANFLVSGFHVISAGYLLYDSFTALYMVSAGILLFYLPFGKLKHTVYFFAARYHLGFFYGWRDVWPPKP